MIGGILPQLTFTRLMTAYDEPHGKDQMNLL